MAEPTPITADAQIEAVNDRTIVRLPAVASAALPSRGQVAAEVVVDGIETTTVIEPDGARGHWLRLDDLADRLPAVGETVTVDVRPIADWPEPDVPDDLQAALVDAPDIAGLWQDITPMARWEWVRWVQATKNPATRARRVDVGISKMRDGKRRPCCFDLSSCTDPEVARSGVLIGVKK